MTNPPDKERLKIAIVAPVWLRVPPTAYGGIELVVALLADGLVDRGHDVTLFATKDARTKAKVVSVFDQPQTAEIGKLAPEVFHAGAAYRRINSEDFDIVHDHCYSGPVLGEYAKPPVLVTLHGEFNEDNSGYFTNFKDAVYYNAISEDQRQSLPGLRYVNTVYNAIDFDNVPVVVEKEEFLLFLSRFSPHKGAHVAIEIAKRAGRRLVLAGKINPVDVEYFETVVEPQIDGDRIKFLSEVTEAEKRRLMGEAVCFLFPILWSEPFGLVMLEAMGSGTPVVAFNRGSASEVIKDGVSGFLANDVDEMVDMIGRVDQLDPRACAAYARTSFSIDKMIDGYLDNYYRILRTEGRIGRSFTVA